MKLMAFLFTMCYLTLTTIGQNIIESKCQIWKPKSYCEIPEHLNLFHDSQGKISYWKYFDCEKINKRNLTGVYIILSSKTDSCFTLTSKFRNISIKKKNTGKIIHPYAILLNEFMFDSKTGKWSNSDAYMKKRFKIKEYLVTFSLKKSQDLILLFDDVEIGDNVVINNYIQIDNKLIDNYIQLGVK